MKKLVKTVLMTFTLSAALGMNAAADKAYTTADVLNVRSQPGMSAEIIGQYTQGSEIDVASVNGDWCLINYYGQNAYVHKDYVSYINYASDAASSQKGKQIVEIAKKYIGTPYVYGGMSPSGFDCSGFVKYVYSQYGVNLNRVAEDQAKNGYWVSRDNLQPGDIICFSSRPGGSYIGHVGIYVGNGQFIHSPQTGYTVTIQSLDGSYYGARYNCARRIF